MSDQPVKGKLPGREFSRGRGCWNCKAFCNDFDGDTRARARWQERRTADLNAAVNLIIEHEAAGDRRGEQHPKIVAIRRSVMQIDHAIMSKLWGICLKDVPQSHFVQDSFLCEKWDGMQGSSVATSGHPLDLLPGELKDKLGDNDA